MDVAETRVGELTLTRDARRLPIFFFYHHSFTDDLRVMWLNGNHGTVSKIPNDFFKHSTVSEPLHY